MKTKVLLATRDYMHRHLGSIVTFVASALVVLAASFGFAQLASAQTFAPITGQASVGSRGTNVVNIQTFLASNPEFYPEGLTTGYYGSLTMAAVKRFQAYYGIVSSGTPTTTGYGRVGPATMAKMNQLIAGGAGGGGVSTDRSAPYISNVSLSTTSNGTTVTWLTTESSLDTLYYSTSPIRFNEGDVNSNGFAVLNGQLASTNSGFTTSHSGVISGLSPNTTYYYLIVSRDASGNVSVSLPGATFRTGN
jgi:peptidoglycan hydrolase-like protein with peptidoglycan-binding domain